MCLWHHTVGLGHLAQLWHSCGSVGQTSIRTVNIYYAARILNTVYISAPNTVNTQAHVSAGRQCILTYSTNTKFLAGYHWLCTNAVSRWIQFQNLAGGPPAYSFLETMQCLALYSQINIFLFIESTVFLSILLRLSQPWGIFSTLLEGVNSRTKSIRVWKAARRDPDCWTIVVTMISLHVATVCASTSTAIFVCVCMLLCSCLCVLCMVHWYTVAQVLNKQKLN